MGRVFRLERRRKPNGKATVEVVYGITSLSMEHAHAATLLAILRNQWQIENQLHDVRDVTFNPTWRAFAERLTAKGKAAKVVLVAVARKLLTIIKSQQPWDDRVAKSVATA